MTVSVRPLEWEQVSSRIYDARAAGLGMYRIQHKDGAWMAFKYGDTFRADRETLDEAKAAAQADYEKRILSAIVTTSAGTEHVAGDALSAPTIAENATVAEGWKLLPVEPTEAMYAAAEREWDGRMSARSRGVWQAMLAASPTPPTAQAEPVAFTNADTLGRLKQHGTIWRAHLRSTAQGGADIPLYLAHPHADEVREALDGSRPLPFDREEGGRMVREA